jgi:hypothetical protein
LNESNAARQAAGNNSGLRQRLAKATFFDGGSRQPRRAASMVAMSIFFIGIIA